MKTIPVTLTNVNIVLELSVDDSEQTLAEIVNTISDIKFKLGQLGDNTLIEKFIKILPGTLIKSLALTDANSSPSPVAEVLPDVRDYKFKCHKLCGMTLKNIAPQSLFAMLDLSPWELLEDDIAAIKTFRQFYKPETPVIDLDAVPFENDDINI